MSAELVAAIRSLHAEETDYRGRSVCAYCRTLCHSETGLACEDPDAPYPCETVKLLDRLVLLVVSSDAAGPDAPVAGDEEDEPFRLSHPYAGDIRPYPPESLR